MEAGGGQNVRLADINVAEEIDVLAPQWLDTVLVLPSQNCRDP